MSPGKKKFRIELEDAEGGKYNLSMEGNISREKILKIVEFMDLVNLESTAPNGQGEPVQRPRPASVGDKIWGLVDGKFPYGTFTSSDILELYEDQYNEPIKLSIISTYLSRYSDRGRLVRNRQGKEWIYRSARTATASQKQAQASSAASHDLNL